MIHFLAHSAHMSRLASQDSVELLLAESSILRIFLRGQHRLPCQSLGFRKSPQSQPAGRGGSLRLEPVIQHIRQCLLCRTHLPASGIAYLRPDQYSEESGRREYLEPPSACCRDPMSVHLCCSDMPLYRNHPRHSRLACILSALPPRDSPMTTQSLDSTG